MKALCRFMAAFLLAALFPLLPAASAEGGQDGVMTSRDSIFPKRSGSPTQDPSESPLGAGSALPPKASAADAPATAPADTAAPAFAAQDDPAFSPTATDPYSGKAYLIEDKAEYRSGRLKAVMRGSRGSFGLYAVREDGKEIPLLSSYDFFSSSAFMLRVGRKEYLLNYSGGIKGESRRTQTGVQMAYTIPGKAFFLLDFSFPQGGGGGLSEAVQVSLYTANLGSIPQTFTSKAIFDTILGESSSHHFSSFDSPELNTQRKFATMKSDRWISSANKTAAIEFLLYGADITEPAGVTLGPLSSLTKSWEPTVHEGKGFSTVLSYNNSALAVNWKPAYLLPQQVDKKAFYIVAAEGGGDNLLSALEGGRSPFLPEAATGSADGAGAGLISEGAETPVGAARDRGAERPSEAALGVSEQQLDWEYIQNLIDYIESLQGPDDINRDEYDSLSEELDAIFERVRSVGN